MTDYATASKGETDVPEGAAEFIGQRRRWLNGSFAASLYAIMHFGRLYSSGHGIIRLLFLHIQLLYNFANVLFTWFSLASYYLTTTVIMTLVGTPQESADYHGWPFGDKVTPVFNVIIGYIYVAFIILQFILALGNRPKGSKKTYLASFVVFGLIQGYILILTTYLVYRAFSTKPIEEQISLASGKEFFDSFFGGSAGVAGLIMIALVTIYGLNFIASFLYLDPWHMFHSFPQYLVLMSTYINILMVYAFNNWHDVSWGTKGSDVAESLPSAQIVQGEKEITVEEIEQEQEDIDSRFEKVVRRALAPVDSEEEGRPEKKDTEDSYKSFRTGLTYSWLLSNILLVIGVTSDDLSMVGLGVSLSWLIIPNLCLHRLECLDNSYTNVLQDSVVRDCCAVFGALLRILVVPMWDRYQILPSEEMSFCKRSSGAGVFEIEGPLSFARDPRGRKVLGWPISC